MGHESRASLFSHLTQHALILRVMCYFFLMQVDRYFSRKLPGIFHPSWLAFFTQVDSQLALPRTKEFCGQDRPSQSRSSQIRSSQVRTDQVRNGQVTSGQNRSVQARIGQVRRGLLRPKRNTFTYYSSVTLLSPTSFPSIPTTYQ